jgi:hypothetical protein
MTREQIERTFALFGTVLAASAQDTERRRTSYFYRRQAIEWARMARQWWPGVGDMQSTCRNLAKHYLKAYRQMKTNNKGTV